MKKKIINGLLLVATIVVATSSFVSCKDYDGDNYAELKEQLRKETSLREDLEGTVSNLNGLLLELQDKQNQCKQNCEDLKNKLNDYLTKAEAANIYLTKDEASNTYVTKAVYDAQVQAFIDQINALVQEIAALKAQDVALQNSIDLLTQDLANAKQTLAQIPDLIDAKIAAMKAIIDGDIANLKTLLEGKIDNLQIQFTNLDGKVQILDGKVTALEGKVNTLEISLRDLNGKVDGLEIKLNGEVTRLDGRIDGLSSDIEAIQTAIGVLAQSVSDNYQELDGRIDALETDMAEVLVSLQNVTDLANEAKEIAQQAKDKADQASIDAGKALNDAAAAKDAADKATNTATDAKEKAATALEKAQNAYDLATTANNNATEALNIANANKEAIAQLDSKFTETIKAIGERITSVESQITNLVNSINSRFGGIDSRLDALEYDQTAQWLRMSGMSDSLATAYANALSAYALAETNRDNIASMMELYLGLERRIDALDINDVKLKYSIDSLANVTTTLFKNIDEVAKKSEELYKKAHEYADTVKTFVMKEMNTRVDSLVKVINEELKTADGLTNGRIDSLNNAINPKFTNLENAYKKADALLNKRIDSLNNAINKDIKPQLEKNTKAIEKLQNTFTNVIAKFITGIELQATENDVIGSFALPVGVRSLILATYHGNVSSYGLEFPTEENTNYVNWSMADTQTRLTIEDMLMLQKSNNGNVLEQFTKGANKVLLGGDRGDGTHTGNAGTLYLTVNPSSVDFTGTEFILENSVKQKSACILEDLRKSNHKISFGYTRGQVVDNASNGFYEAQATIEEDALKNVRLNFSLSDLKEVAKDLKSWRDGISLTNLGTTIYNNMGNLLDANAVKATWKDSLGTHSVFSQYGIAATAIKPLSFGFMYDKTYDRVPGLDRLERFVDKLIDQVKVRNRYLHPFADISTIHVNKIQFTPGEQRVLVHVTITVDGVDYEDTVDITTQVDTEVMLLLEDYNNEVDEVNEALDNLIAQLRDYSIEEMVETTKTDLKNNLHKYFDKFNNKLKRFMTPNTALQPILLVKVENGYGGFKLASKMKNMPSKVATTSFKLIPTSYTCELLAPSFKKHIAVTNVFKASDYTKSAQGGDNDCKSALFAANKGEMNKVIDGGLISIPFEGQSGYVYEIAYSAVDYHGKIVVKKFYVGVK